MSESYDTEANEAQQGDAPDEEELRARLEEELKKITVRDVLVQTAVTLINLGGQRLGLTETTRDARDPEQSRLAIEAVRALLPLLEADPNVADHVRPLRDALSQLQMAYARDVGAGEPPEREPGPATGETPREQPRRPSGRLWVPPGSEG